MISKAWIWTSASVLVVGCAMNPTPVVGPRADVSRLEGEWIGAYSSVESGRHGDIGFVLEAGSDTARGYVYMMPHVGHEVMPAVDEPYDAQFDTRLWGQGLWIEFVRVEGDRISGQMAQYRDPDCGCRLHTAFIGRLEGDRIDGTFTSRHVESRAVSQGEWWVTRQPSP